MTATFPTLFDPNGPFSMVGCPPLWTSTISLLPVTAVPSQSFTPTAAQRATAIQFYWSAAPSAVTGANPGSYIYDTTSAGDIWLVKADGSTVQWMDNGVLCQQLRRPP